METFGAFQYGHTFSIIFPLAERSLEDYFEQEKTFPSEHIWAQMRGLAQGLAFLHGLRDDNVDKTTGKKKEGSIIIAYHLDLKPENILITNGTFQIADFGLSTIKSKIANNPHDEDSGAASTEGYRVYAPPEHDRPGKKYYGAHDLWSLGAIFSEMATHDIRPTGKARESVLNYRTDLQFESGPLQTGVRRFHIEGKLKTAVSVQHHKLEKAAQNQGSLDRPDQQWQKWFYQSTFFVLLRKMLDRNPRSRGTAAYVAKTLEKFSMEPSESSILRGQSDQGPPGSLTIWEHVDTMMLQKDYDIPSETFYLYVPCRPDTHITPVDTALQESILADARTGSSSASVCGILRGP